MKRFLLSFRKQGAVTPEPSGSDLVSLGILRKQISEFSNSDIGTEVSIPYSNEGSGISGPIVFEVVGVNHHVTTEYPQTITLMTKNIIRLAAFDAAEPDNSDSNRKSGGNNRWSVSNIRQWLNSSGAAGSWFTAQHEYDAAPTSAYVHDAKGAYADAPGFLAGFSTDVLQHFTDITNITALHKVDNGGSSGGSEETVDKVFLPSYTEMGLGNNGNVAEGTHLSVRYPDDNSRRKFVTGAQGSYWLRSPDTDSNNVKRIITISGRPNYLSNKAYSGQDGIAPIIVLH